MQKVLKDEYIKYFVLLSNQATRKRDKKHYRKMIREICERREQGALTPPPAFDKNEG